MPKVLRPRHESPTPLMRVVLPLVLVALLVVQELTVLEHPLAAIIPEVIGIAILAPVMLAVRGWIWTVGLGIVFALMTWAAGLIVLFALHPPS